MHINAYKEYRFAFGKLVATDTGKEYSFSISRKDRFYHYMEEHIKKGVVDFAVFSIFLHFSLI